MTAPDTFDWSAENIDVVVVRQPAIAVYENASGAITIRREAELDEEEDPIIVVTKANVPALVRAILHVAGSDLGLVRALGNGAYEDDRPAIGWRAAHADFDQFEAAERVTKSPKDPTAAERQRRSRASRKGTVTSVTADRDSHTNGRHSNQPELPEVLLLAPAS